ncbi:MAG: LuxR C-terminal-related transcriptional regulator, partial [Rhizobacter sp.]
TSREVDVLRLLSRGQCNKAIATDLDIAVGTVKAHVKAIMGKLDARSRTHAVTVAAGRGRVDEAELHEGRLAGDPGRSFATPSFPVAAPFAS